MSAAPCTPTPEDRDWLRAHLGTPDLPDDQTDALLVAHECDRLAALADGLDILAAEAATLTDYSLGAVRESTSQVFAHLMARRKAAADALVARDAAGMGIGRSLSLPTEAVW